MDFDYSPKTKALQAELKAFMDEHIYPAEGRWTAPPPRAMRAQD
jgi:acyl-CoA dehydrogenase